MAILAYLTLKAFIYKGIKSAKVVGGLEMRFGGLELKFEKVATLFKANHKDKLAKDLDTYDDVMQGFKVLLDKLLLIVVALKKEM